MFLLKKIAFRVRSTPL